MLFENQLAGIISNIFSELFGKEVTPQQLSFQATRKDYKGDLTLVVFNLAKLSGKSPEETGNIIGEALIARSELVSGYNTVKGFLNIEINNKLFLKELHNLSESFNQVKNEVSGPPYLVEYSSPNTNKPLHLGHIRNNLLGFSISRILEYNQHKVVKVNIINDRGIHICKSMLAWQKHGNGETPGTSGIKGDHLVGKYYVLFDKHYKAQVAQLESKGFSKEEAEKQAPLIQEAQEMLRKWESGDHEVIQLWQNMNSWVYEGFDQTYKALGVEFDKIYYESQTYLLGKELVEDGLEKKVLYRKEDGSVWIDLKEDGLDEKLLIRSDGTSVYMTQDLGTAVKRFEEYEFEKMIYVVGNEQDYHFKVLFLILKKLGYHWADNLYHLSYNMVDLPSGKMKSREGTVVDADDLMAEMVESAKKLTMELGKLDNFESEEAQLLYTTIGMGALKYFLLKVDPEKRMMFNPEESIDFNGNTGPFIQYSYARIQSVIRKAQTLAPLADFKRSDYSNYTRLIDKEKELVKIILRFNEAANEAAVRLSPAIIANYIYELAKTYNQFYHEHPIIDPDNVETSRFRLMVSDECAKILKTGTHLLGIDVPERM